MNKIIGHAEGNTAYLVPARANIMSNLRTVTWLRMRLGDPSKLPSVKAELENLFARVSDTTQKAQMLAADRTRTKAQQHMAAKTLARGLSSDLRRYAEIFGKKGAELQNDGQAVADRILGPHDNYGYLQSEIRGWIREQVKTPEGMQRVSDAYKSDLQTASTLYSSPHFLLGMSAQLHTSMRLKAVELFAPTGLDLLSEGIELEAKAKNYEKVVSDVHGAYYNAELVEAAEASRVEV
ncbi:hypothetical protein [Alloyangia pacifica]|uniref:hypothetical protein n=1 Tax=Alloyangia pacifica TaxID=311180 RepID=UPI001CD1ABC9|nr:hypothetical protein [Alloyangia pacifica]MCA0996179.1 hypothetical protein [Alloyangia pacifica]